MWSAPALVTTTICPCFHGDPSRAPAVHVRPIRASAHLAFLAVELGARPQPLDPNAIAHGEHGVELFRPQPKRRRARRPVELHTEAPALHVGGRLRHNLRWQAAGGSLVRGAEQREALAPAPIGRGAGGGRTAASSAGKGGEAREDEDAPRLPGR